MTEAVVDASASHPRPTRAQRVLASLGRFRLTRLGLRTRVLLMFSFGALLLAVFLAAAAYSFTRSSLVTSATGRRSPRRRATATVASAELSGLPVDAETAIRRLRALGVDRTAIFYRDTWRASDPTRYGDDQIPPRCMPE